MTQGRNKKTRPSGKTAGSLRGRLSAFSNLSHGSPNFRGVNAGNAPFVRESNSPWTGESTLTASFVTGLIGVCFCMRNPPKRPRDPTQLRSVIRPRAYSVRSLRLRPNRIFGTHRKSPVTIPLSQTQIGTMHYPPSVWSWFLNHASACSKCCGSKSGQYSSLTYKSA